VADAEIHEGGCHCGRVRFRVRGTISGVTDCNCSVCTKKGILHWIVASERFEILRGEGELETYRFGSGVARHRFCRHCGMHPFYVPRSDPEKIDVNVRCLDDVDLGALEISPFDGREWESAITKKVPWR
jgi:hypothetical protein